MNSPQDQTKAIVLGQGERCLYHYAFNITQGEKTNIYAVIQTEGSVLMTEGTKQAALRTKQKTRFTLHGYKERGGVYG